MKRLLPFAALALCSVPGNAASMDTTRVSLVIPVSCGIEIAGETVSANRLTLTLHRRCNTWHAITVDSAGFEGKPVAMRFDQTPVTLSGGSARLPQHERYFDGTDTLVIDTKGSPDDIERLARSLRVTIEQA